VTVATVFEDLSGLPATGITYKSKFVDGWYQAGFAVGKAGGKARGFARGQARVILRVLKSRGLRPTLAQRELIESSEDLDLLDRWLDRAITGTTVEMVFEG
jgi:hypothetical protein